MANLTTRPVLNGNDLSLLLSGLALLKEQSVNAAMTAAKDGAFEDAGFELSVVSDIDTMEERLNDLVQNLIEEAMAESVDGAFEDESLPTADEDDIPTIPMSELIEGEE